MKWRRIDSRWIVKCFLTAIYGSSYGRRFSVTDYGPILTDGLLPNWQRDGFPSVTVLSKYAK